MARRDKSGGGLVYSTQFGKMCAVCGRADAECVCRAQAAAAPATDGFVRVGRETSGRKGTGVTVVIGVPLAGPELARLAQSLRQKCGAGGTIKDGVIEVQGEHRDTLVAELTRLGYKTKRVGG